MVVVDPSSSPITRAGAAGTALSDHNPDMVGDMMAAMGHRLMLRGVAGWPLLMVVVVAADSSRTTMVGRSMDTCLLGKAARLLPRCGPVPGQHRVWEARHPTPPSNQAAPPNSSISSSLTRSLPIPARRHRATITPMAAVRVLQLPRHTRRVVRRAPGHVREPGEWLWGRGKSSSSRMPFRRISTRNSSNSSSNSSSHTAMAAAEGTDSLSGREREALCARVVSAWSVDWESWWRNSIFVRASFLV
mmetsp:Transcript_27003/g.67259  ORF Transcript_27003/g.67259 Transcript_27003/m.67259 type:complete len:246 (+) Transcript_27003:434-1171(+)